jgi:hypothetical protein
MSTEAAANPVDSGSDSVQPSDALDNPASLDFYEPEEDQANEEAEGTGTETNGETDEAPQGQEAEAETAETAESETEETEPEPQGKAPADDVIISMPDGQKLELKELKSGYMRDGDYRRKTQELATKRRDLDALSTRVTNTVNAISELLMQQVPPAPDHNLALTDMVAYMQQKALHDAGMAKVNAIVEQANQAKSVTNTLTQEKTAEEVAAEISKLGEAFPQIKTPDGQKKFFEGAIGAGRELGFTDADLNAVTDHRHFKVLHYAALGLQAEKAKQVAKAKVKDVPPVTPPPKRQSAPSAQKARANQEAMSRLAKTGSIHDAMSIDFD